MRLEYRYLANPKKVRNGEYSGMPVDVLGWTQWTDAGVYSTNTPSQEFTCPLGNHPNYLAFQARVTE